MYVHVLLWVYIQKMYIPVCVICMSVKKKKLFRAYVFIVIYMFLIKAYTDFIFFLLDLMLFSLTCALF